LSVGECGGKTKNFLRMAQNQVSRKNIEFGNQTFTQTPGFDPRARKSYW
jgi:hypothetical protein